MLYLAGFFSCGSKLFDVISIDHASWKIFARSILWQASYSVSTHSLQHRQQLDGPRKRVGSLNLVAVLME